MPSFNVLELPLWKDSALSDPVKPETVDYEQPTNNRFITNISCPTITIYFPEKPCGAAVIICPGGGYAGVSFDKEGLDVARWLTQFGITGIALKYRLPGDSAGKKITYSHTDGLRALAMVYESAKSWNLDHSKIGIMGFSAGGHLAASLCMHCADLALEIPFFNQKPSIAFQLLIYPVISMFPGITHEGSRENLLGKKPSQELITYYSMETQVVAKTPPTFLVHSTDDTCVPVSNSTGMYESCQKYGVASEMHIFSEGGHGYGMGVNGGEVTAWPKRLSNWLAALNFC